MTELETLQRAKMYIDKLANGVNPLTDSPAGDGDIVNNIRISRCLFYVSDVLRRVIENGGEVGAAPKKPKKQQFNISQEQLDAYIPTNTAIPISDFVERINDLVISEGEQTTKLRYTAVTSWLIEAGMLEEKINDLGKKKKCPTEQGHEIGIFTEERFGQNGPYTVVLYSKAAQQFIIDNFSAILGSLDSKSSNSDEASDYQGRFWSSEHEECLTDLFRKGVPVSEIAVTLKRTETGVRARLKKLGLIKNRSDAL